MAPIPCSNAFTAVRWFFALSLVLFHGCAATGHAYGWIDPRSIVDAFFVMSGMLTCNSYMLRPGSKGFFLRRLRKIAPPYAAVVLSAAAGGVFLTTLGAREYLTSPDTLKYVAANLAFLNFLAPELPGVFGSNTFAAVNPALWTMKVEVAFYALLPALVALMRRFGGGRVLAAAYLLSAAWNVAFACLHQSAGGGMYDELRRQLPGQMMYFAAGMAAARLWPAIMRRRYAALACGMAVWALALRFPVLSPARPAAIAAALTVIAFGSPRLSRLSALAPNLTFEVYLLHCPVIQTLAAAGCFAAAGFPAAIAASAAVTLALAALLRFACKAAFPAPSRRP